MRLYPPAYAVGRMAIQEVTIGGQRIPSGIIVIVSPYVMHHDQRYWPEPESFRPDRFMGEAEAKRPKFSYFPFGGGARVCIGERFAWMEGVIVLATIAQRWRLELDPSQHVEAKAQITLRPKSGMRMRLHGNLPTTLP